MTKSTRFLFTCIAALILPIAVTAQKSVFVIESYHAEYGWDAGYRKGLEEGLGAKYKLEYFEMDTKRIPPDQFQKKSDQAWDRYLALKPDLVVIGDDPALIKLAARFAAVKTPVVYLGINNNPRDVLPDTATNFTGVLERPLLKRSVLYIRSLLPNVKRLAILFDNSVTAQIVRKETFGCMDSVDISGIAVEIKLLGTIKEWQDFLSAMKGKYDACVIGLYQTVLGADGKNYDSNELIKWVSKNSPVPPFAFWDFAVGAEMTIGGLVLYGKEMGVLAAGLVKKVMEEGKAPKDIIPLINDQGQFLFSKSQLAKWKLTLPTDVKSKAIMIE